VSVNNTAVFREITSSELPSFLTDEATRGCTLASQLNTPLTLPLYPMLPPPQLFVCEDKNVTLTSELNHVTNPGDPALFPESLTAKKPAEDAQLSLFFSQTLPAIAVNRWYEVEYVVGSGVLNRDAFVILVNPTNATVSKLLDDSTASLLWSRLSIPNNTCSLFSASIVVLKMVSMRKRSVFAVYRLPWSDPYFKLKDGGDVGIRVWSGGALMSSLVAGTPTSIRIERRKMTKRISTDPNGPPKILGGDKDSVDMFFHQIVPVYARTRLYDLEYSVTVSKTRIIKDSLIASYFILVNPTKPTLEALALRKDVLAPLLKYKSKDETVASDYYKILKGTSVAVFKSTKGKFVLHGHAKTSADSKAKEKSSNSSNNSNSPSAPVAPGNSDVDTDADARAERDVVAEDKAEVPSNHNDKLSLLMAQMATAINSYGEKLTVVIKRTRFQAIRR
jgi:hypothetical protein